MAMATNKGKLRSGRRRWPWVVLLLVVIVLIAVALRPTPIEVDLVTIVRGPMQVTLDEEGVTRVRERYVVSAPVSGQVLRITLEPGDPVVAGETVVATFQPAPPSLLDSRSQAEAQARLEGAEADLGLARAELARADAQLRFATSEHERIKRLAIESIVSQAMLDSALLEVEAGRENHNAAQFAVRTAEHNLEQTRAALMQGFGGPSGNAPAPIDIRSPVEGVVLRRLRESASVVPAGEPLIEVADPARMEIVSDYLSEDAVKIPVGADVLIERWGGETVLGGRVRRVEPSGFTKISALGVEEQRVNVIIDFEDPQEAWVALGDGYRVEVRVVIWQQPDVLKLPTSSLFRAGDGWAVFRVIDDVVQLTSVEIGWRNGIEAQVLSGLTADDRVVVHPSDAISDGVAVEQRRS